MAKHTFPDVPPTVLAKEVSGINPHHIFTQIEARMLNVLADSLPHEFDELLECLQDKEAGAANLYVHIQNIRNKIRPYGGDINCVKNSSRRFCYQRVKAFVRVDTSDSSSDK